MSTVATKRIGTRRKPTSPLHPDIPGPEHIVKEAGKIQRSESSPALYTSKFFDLISPFSHSEEKKENLSRSIPTLPVISFQVFIDPWSFKKEKTQSPRNIPLFQFKTIKIPLQPSSSLVNKPFPSPNPISSTIVGQQPLDLMDRMVAARYAPLVLPHPLNALPGGDYQKYLPRFNGQGETIA